MRLALLIFGAIAVIPAPAPAQAISEQVPRGSTVVDAGLRAIADQAEAQRPDSTGARARAAIKTPPQTAEPGARRARLQLGVSLKSTLTPGEDTANALNPTFVWRWRGRGSRIDDRWAPAYRLSSFSSRVSSPLAGRELDVGDVKLRPLMLGIDYKMPRGRWNWAAGVSAGWAMNNVDTPWQYRARAIDAAGAGDLWVDVHNSFVWGPRLKGWYDVNRRLSFMVESAYLVTRPVLDVRANGVLTTRRLNADALILKAGLVYGIF